MVIAWRSVVDGCVLICLLCRVFFKVRANRRVGKSKDPKNRVPEIAVPDLVDFPLLPSDCASSLLPHDSLLIFFPAPNTMSAIKRRAVVSGLLGASASCIGKIALDPESLVQSKARGICNLFVSADATRIISVIGASIQSGLACKAVEVCIRGLCLLLMILTNAVMMTTFLDGINESGTVAGTALANAANFTLSAIYGVLFFEESITTMWIVGFAMILAGAWILSSIQMKENKADIKNDKKGR